MNGQEWIILDVETTGFSNPIYVVEVGAQLMSGWVPQGPPFRRLLNQNKVIPQEASRVHGYTREILERDGEAPDVVYEALRAYAQGLPFVTYNLDYDLTRVLVPEWKRLGVSAMGENGLCALRLAQRLLDPVPAGNCKLQTLRQYYRMPERGAHTALGDVLTVVDLFGDVLRPIAERRGLNTWEEVKAFIEDEWYPSRITFGKHKGKSVYDARQDVELRSWLEWLTRSTNAKNASIGRWYLRHLTEFDSSAMGDVATTTDEAKGDSGISVHGLIVFVCPEVRELERLVDSARARLAQIETELTVERARVSAMQAQLFQRLSAHYSRRDRLRLLIQYRQQYLQTLQEGRGEEAESVGTAHKEAQRQKDAEYSEAEAMLSTKSELSEEEVSEVKRLWRKLVSLYHPDRFAQDPDKQAAYHKLISTINQARDDGDLATLRSIAEDPEAFVLRQGWTALDFGIEKNSTKLRGLWEGLEIEIVEMLEALNALRESSEFCLYQECQTSPDFLDKTATRLLADIGGEIEALQKQADNLEIEIAELTGEEGCEVA